jgi:hypothetical protein
MSKHNPHRNPKFPFPCWCDSCGGNAEYRKGNCYETCAHYVLTHGGYLVHGHICAPDEIAGTVNHPELDHAWVELLPPHPFGVPMIWEPVLSREMPRVLWDKKYNARYDAVYDTQALRRKLREYETYGPWPEDPVDGCWSRNGPKGPP